MFLAAVRRLYEYDRWATGRVLDTAAGLTPTQFTSELVPGQKPVRDTLVHMLDAHICHLSWLDGSMTRDASFARKFPPVDYPDIAAVRAFRWRVQAETAAFLATLRDDSDLGRVYTRTLKDGTSLHRPMWEVLLHLANHSTQHRSEVAMMLTAAGHSPGDLDLL